MSDFSRSPQEMLQDSQQKGYIGLHIEQGVPILDRDLNLLHDLVAAGMRSLFTRYVGDGVAAGTNGFAIQALPTGQNRQDFQIAAGPCLVGGVEVSIPAPGKYSAQTGIAPLTTPNQAESNPRIDTVYLDLSQVEVDGATDPDLTNPHDVGMQTSVRTKLVWVVRVAEGMPMPTEPEGHRFHELAKLHRPSGNEVIEATMIEERRKRGLTVSDLERRLDLLEKVLLLPAFVKPPFTPPSGQINQTIALNGTNFDIGPASSVAVLFGNRQVRQLTSISATEIRAQVPTDVVPAGTNFIDVKITIRTAVGEVVSDDTFRAARVVQAPTFASPPFSPTNGTAGDTITLHGDNFNWPNLKVKFDNTNAPDLVGSPSHTQIKVNVPPMGLAAGSFKDVAITVTTDGGSVTSTDLFRAGG